MYFSKQERLLAVIPHILAMLPIPPFNIIAVYVFRAIVGDRSPLIDNHARENLNFQLSYYLYALSFFLFLFTLQGLGSLLDTTAIDLPPVFAILGIGTGFMIFGILLLQGFVVAVLLIAAIIKALMGKYYKFPLVIRFFK